MFIVCQAYLSGAVARAESIQECALAIQVQCDALEAARGNLKDHAKALVRSHDRFRTSFLAQQEAQNKLMESSERDLDALAKVKLHPALAKPGRQTLQDCVPVAKLREWKRECAKSHSAVRRRVDALAEMVQTMREGVDSQLAEVPLSEDSAKLVRNMVERAAKLQAAQSATAESLTKDRETGEREIKETASHLPTSASQSTDVLNACRLLEQLHQHHQTTQVPEMKRVDDQLAECQVAIAKVKTALTKALVSHLRTVSELQSQIRYQGNRLSMLKENAKLQQAAVGELLHVQCMPSAYTACLDEVRVRQQYFRSYVATVDAMADKLAQLCDQEKLRRKHFLQKHGIHLPQVSGCCPRCVCSVY